jgi:hypothetical protein
MKLSSARQNPPESGKTGLPLLRTWTSVYLFVIISNILWVALLIALTNLHS